MKKLFILFLALILVLSAALLIGCASDKGNVEKKENSKILELREKAQNPALVNNIDMEGYEFTKTAILNIVTQNVEGCLWNENSFPVLYSVIYDKNFVPCGRISTVNDGGYIFALKENDEWKVEKYAFESLNEDVPIHQKEYNFYYIDGTGIFFTSAETYNDFVCINNGKNYSPDEFAALLN